MNIDFNKPFYRLYDKIEYDSFFDSITIFYRINNYDCIAGEDPNLISKNEKISGDPPCNMDDDESIKQYLYYRNKEEYIGLTHYLNNLEENFNSHSDAESQIYLMAKELWDAFIYWYHENEFEKPSIIIDGTNLDGNIVEGVPKPKPLDKQLVDKLFKELEADDYKITIDDSKVIEHPSFKLLRSKYIKKKHMKDNFSIAFDELNKFGRLTFERFKAITKAPSKWYEEKLRNSFKWECQIGQFKSASGTKKIHIGQANHNDELVDCFIL